MYTYKCNMRNYIAGYRKYPDLYDFSLPANANASNLEYWTNVLNANLPDVIGSTNQHDVFKYFLDQLTTSLHTLNGGIGDPSDYLYFAHLTLNSVTHNDNFSESDLQNLKDTFEQNVMVPNGGVNNFG